MEMLKTQARIDEIQKNCAHPNKKDVPSPQGGQDDIWCPDCDNLW